MMTSDSPKNSANVSDAGADGGGASSSGNNTAAATAASAVVAGGGGSSSNKKKKMFFTTSDLIERMNSSIKESFADGNNDNALVDSSSSKGGGGFELQRKMPDGTYRRAERSEMAAADFQAKMKQACEMIAGLEPMEKIEWAKRQRCEGNALFANGEYKEAMDVYLTCLVAMDHRSTTTSSSGNDEEKKKPSSASVDAHGGCNVEGPQKEDEDLLLANQIDKEIKLPVLLNLALSALKLGMLSKAEKFCNFAILETGEVGRRSVKAHFRRGRVRMLMGNYGPAEEDLDKALELLDGVERKASSETIDNDDNSDDSDAKNDVENTRAVVLRENQKLNRLVDRAERNRRQQKRAMEMLFQLQGRVCGDDGGNAPSSAEAPGLYPEKKRLPPKRQQYDRSKRQYDDDRDLHEEYQPTCFQWYMHMVGRCAQKLLDIIGDDEEYDDADFGDIVPHQHIMLNELKDKKDA